MRDHGHARIRRAAQRMKELIDALLRLSRVSRAAMHRGGVNLTALARTIAHNLQQQAPQRAVAWMIGEGLQAEGDPALLQIALENLLGNAWKFTARQSPARIEFDVGALPAGEQEAGAASAAGQRLFVVRDNGVGFDPQQAGRLFRAFERLHGQDEFPGTGVGLATVQRIIERHGGRIWATGQPGQGAAFYFTLPVGAAGAKNCG